MNNNFDNPAIVDEIKDNEFYKEISTLIGKVQTCINKKPKIAGYKSAINHLNDHHPIEWFDDEGVYPRKGKWLGYMVEEWEPTDFVVHENIFVINENDTLM